jgi:hypothetical protein
MLNYVRLYRSPEGDAGGGAGDAGAGDGGTGDTTVNVDHGDAGDKGYKPPELDMATALPPEYREKPFLKGKDFITIIKEFDNAQKLIGARPAGIPAADAPDADWDKFIGTMRPKDLAEYKLPETEYSKVNKRTPEYEKAVREIMSEAGVPARMFPKAIAKIESWLASGQEAGKKAQEAAKVSRETEFEKLLDTTYGSDKAKVIERTKALMADSVAPEMKEKVASVLSNISNDALFVLTAVLNGIHAKYISEDNAPGAGGNAGGDSTTLHSEAEGIMRSEAYKDFRNPGHDAAKQKVQDLFKRIAGMKK